MNDHTETLRTARLVLRPWQRADLDAMAQWPPFPDPLDAAWNWARTLHEQGTLTLLWVGRNLDTQRIEWTVTLHDGTIVGHLSLRAINEQQRSAWLGIGFGAPYVERGYGTELLQAFLVWYRDVLRFATLRLDVALHNTRALRLYERLGFQRVRTFWYQQELPTDWRFLRDQRYDAIRHLFREGQDGMYIQCVEMERTMSPDRAGS